MNFAKPPVVLRIVFLLLVSVAAVGCSSSDPLADGNDALQRNEHAKALASFDEALTGMQPSDAKWLDAKQGQIAALAKVDPTRAQTESIALIKSHKDALGEKGARAIASKLLEGGAYLAAFEFLKATVEPWPVSEQLDAAFGFAQAKSAQLASPEVLAELQGLGYIGGDSAEVDPNARRPGSKTPAKSPPKG